jgi:hypothetical protein
LENHWLQTVAAACGYELEDHHYALAGAEVCAWIEREILSIFAFEDTMITEKSISIKFPTVLHLLI